MKKRLKKKLEKKALLNMPEVNVNEPKGYGVVLGGGNIIHCYDVGDIVKITGTSYYGKEYIDCFRESDDLDQTLHRDQIRIY